VQPEALSLLAGQAMVDISHLLRPGHLQQLADILKDPEASKNDRYVLLAFEAMSSIHDIASSLDLMLVCYAPDLSPLSY
jgi:tartrate dehydratase alpha subunit/fumarate hydratase class I-like protein